MKECVLLGYRNRKFIFKQPKTKYAKEDGVMFKYVDKTQDYSFLLKYFQENDIRPQKYNDDVKFTLLELFWVRRRKNSPDIEIRERDQLNFVDRDHLSIRTSTPVTLVKWEDLPSPSKYGDRQNYESGYSLLQKVANKMSKSKDDGKEFSIFDSKINTEDLL